ncbi:unnamed protein product [Discula destructiva]
MALKSPRTRDLEKSQSVRFGSVQYLDDPRSSVDSDTAARPQVFQPRHTSWRSRIISPEVIPWILTCVFATTTILLLLERPETWHFGSYETAFITDLQSLANIPLEIRRFGGSPLCDENGTVYAPPVDGSWPESSDDDFASRTMEADSNWSELLENRYFSVSEEEATDAWGEMRHEYVDLEEGGYTAALDVFHTLHCLNEIRMALQPDKYDVDTSEAHTAHCLDTIRQHIQCYGSTTLIPAQYGEGAHHQQQQQQHVKTDQEHVCRDFSYLRDFVQRRSPAGDLYVPRGGSAAPPGSPPGTSSGLDEVEIKVVEGEVPA